MTQYLVDIRKLLEKMVIEMKLVPDHARFLVLNRARIVKFLALPDFEIFEEYRSRRKADF